MLEVKENLSKQTISECCHRVKKKSTETLGADDFKKKFYPKLKDQITLTLFNLF